MLVKSLSDFIGIHKGSKIVVCGCGTSLSLFKEHSHKWITIGVNDVPAMFDPTYLLVADHHNRFWGKRKELVMQAKCKNLFVCTKGWRHPGLVHFELGGTGALYLDHTKKIDHFLNSPYLAVGLAYKMGATNIGLIGVDFTEGHFYNSQDGFHPIIKTNSLSKVDSAYSLLKSELLKRGTSLFNLSQTSRLTLPKITIEEFEKL